MKSKLTKKVGCEWYHPSSLSPRLLANSLASANDTGSAYTSVVGSTPSYSLREEAGIVWLTSSRFPSIVPDRNPIT